LLLLPLLAWLGATAFAQSAYEIQVYPSGTVERGRTFVELHSNTAAKGPADGPGELQPDAGAAHETLEVTHGFTDWFETGFYLFTSARDGEGWDWAGTHLRPRVMAPASWGWPVGVSLSGELGYLRPRFSGARWDMELRPIVDKKWGRLYVSVNPALERALAPYGGESASFVFAPALKAGWDTLAHAAFGIEYYGTVGPVERFSSPSAQQHQLYAVYDLINAASMEINAGVGAGLTDATDRLVLKLIVGRRF
jgi:hypothetical protein